MRNLKKILAVVLTLCMMCSMFVMFGTSASAAAPTGCTQQVGETKWVNNNGEIVGWNRDKSIFMGAPFKYSYFVEGTYTGNPPSDAVSSGFADMVWPTAGGFSDQRYTATNDTSVAAFYEACYAGSVLGGWYHVSPGVTFEAPYSGTIEFTYQAFTNGVAKTLYIGKNTLSIFGETASGYVEAKQLAVVSDVNDTTAHAANQFTISLDVTAGDMVYFVVDCASNGSSSLLYINSAEYTSIEYAGNAECIGHSIAALENPVVNFYVQLDGEIDNVEATVTVGNDAALTVTGESYVGEGPNGTTIEASDYVYVYSVPVSAKRMTETITISLKSEGTEMLTENNTYSVAEYCNAQIAAYKADTTDEDMHDLAIACTGILMYGKTMQQYFGYNTANLPVLDATLLDEVVADLKAN